MIRRSTYALALASLALATSAHATTVTFDDVITRTTGGGTDIDYNLGHGDVVTSGVLRTALRQTYGIRISVNNINVDLSSNPDAYNDPGVIFDTSPPTDPGNRDPDLVSPFDGGNIANATLHNALIIQEAGVPTGTPDDEGKRPAGNIRILFDTPVESFGFDIIDLENGAEVNGSNILTFERIVGSRNVRLDIPFASFIDSSSPFFVSGLQFGDNYANQVPEFDLNLLNGVIDANNLANGTSLPTFDDGIDRIVISLGGSAAIDNLTFTNFNPPPPVIPTPAAAGAGLAMLGMLLSRRR
ncbi:MAG: hypothetical protein RLN76_04615 [Phycisphaeraceae bacterium]